VNVAPYENSGFVAISWDRDSSQDSEWYAWRVYRRRDDMLTYDLLTEETNDEAFFDYHDYLCPSNMPVDYVVVQVASRFGSLVESNRINNEVLVTAAGTKYWLIHEDSKPDSIRFDICTSDDPTDEYEQGEMAIFGRGRKVDEGTRWGYRGELVARILNNDRATARDSRLAINKLRFDQTVVHVRTPFGDIIRAKLGDCKFSRDAGVGTVESGTITIPYTEVYE
jgi:hypothetical protein